jgi:hypothetical protein
LGRRRTLHIAVILLHLAVQENRARKYGIFLDKLGSRFYNDAGSQEPILISLVDGRAQGTF